ncbi:MAG: hypothetical protein WC421_02735 [Elusimicrobiales bacterium]
MAKTVFVDANPQGGIAGTVIRAALLTALNNQRHLGRDVDGDGALDYAEDSGANNAYAVALSPALPEYVAGFPIWFKAASANTGPATLNVNGLGAVAIKKNGVTEMSPGDIAAGAVICVVYDGVAFQPVNLAGEAAQVGDIVFSASRAARPGFIKLNGATLSRSAYAALFQKLVPTFAATISIASPAVISAPAHGLSIGDNVRFTTNGSLPTGLAAGTVYYVIADGFSADAFEVSASPGGAAVVTSGSQSGSHTCWVWAPGLGFGDGSTTFQIFDWRALVLRNWDDGAGIDAARVFGSKQDDAFQGHFHHLTSPLDQSGSTYSVQYAGDPASYTWNHAADTSKAEAAMTDGTHGTPRIAAETRMMNAACMFWIKY